MLSAIICTIARCFSSEGREVEKEMWLFSSTGNICGKDSQCQRRRKQAKFSGKPVSKHTGNSFKKAENRGGNTGFSEGGKDGHGVRKQQWTTREAASMAVIAFFFFFLLFLILEVERHGQEWGF